MVGSKGKIRKLVRKFEEFKEMHEGMKEMEIGNVRKELSENIRANFELFSRNILKNAGFLN